MSLIEHQQQQLKTVFLSPAYTAIAPTKTFVHLPLVSWLENSIHPCLHLTLWLVYWFISLLWVLFWFYERHFTSQLSVLREGWITLRWGHWLEDLWTPAKYPQIPTTWSYFFGEDDNIDHWFLQAAAKYPQIPTTWSYFFGENDDIDNWFLRAATKYPQMPTHQICACG